MIAHHCEASGDTVGAARWYARAARWAEATSPPDAMRLWRRVRDLASALGDLRERDELDNRARIGMLAVAWRLGMAPEDSAAIHAKSSATGEQLLLDLNYALAACEEAVRVMEIRGLTTRALPAPVGLARS